MELKQLVRAAATGDQRAWNRLVCRLTPRLKGWLRSQHRDLDSHDLIQDTLIVVWEKLPDFEMRSEDEFQGWVHKIAQFTALAARRQPRRLEKLARALGQEPAPKTRLSSHLDRAERLEQVRRAADKLPESYRRAVENRLAGGDAGDLAKLAGIKRESARGVESRAFARVRKLLQPSTPPP